MRDWDEVDVGPTPPEEACEQLGPNYDPMRARAECKAYVKLLRRTLGEEPFGAQLRVKSNAHDFGIYLEVVCRYDCGSEAATRYAYRCEGEGPQRWDAEARAELGVVIEEEA